MAYTHLIWTMGTGGYIDYASDDPTDSFVFAKESFFSKLASENIHFSNPINEPEFMRGEYDGGYDEEWVR